MTTFGSNGLFIQIHKHKLYINEHSVVRLAECGRHQYGAPLRPWRYESLRIRAVRALSLRIRDGTN
eukprot:6178284-Pleurochrysis_carterae.AAC.1